MDVKQWAQLVDVHMHIEPQAVHCQWLFVSIHDMAPRSRKAHGADRLILLLVPETIARGNLQSPQTRRQQEHTAQDEDCHHSNRDLPAAQLVEDKHDDSLA